MENKIAKIPVASHGLHKHSYNYPWLSSINFGDVMPCYYNPLRKGEKDSPFAGLYSQLMPIAHNAFATGRFNFKAIFVPYKLVWRPWYAFDQQQNFYSNGQSSRPSRYPYVQIGYFSRVFTETYGTLIGQSDVQVLDDYDVALCHPGSSSSDPGVTYYFELNNAGRRILRILGALGSMPSFIDSDQRTMNILPLMCYIKAFTDYYFPNNYVGGSVYNTLSAWFERDEIDFTTYSLGLLNALEFCSVNFYNNSVFDMAWDNPTTPNVAHNSPAIAIEDITDNTSDPGKVENQNIPNGTPEAITNKGLGFTKYLIDALISVSMWAKRRQLSGARLLDSFLVRRGVSLPNDSARLSYFLGQRNVEIEVSGVENNTDVNLGELAGRGVASTGDKPLSFECRPDDDGIFFIIVSPLPDANFPVNVDGFVMRKDFMDNYNAEFDKLAAAAVPVRLVRNSLNGYVNFMDDDQFNKVFGFLNQYWDEVQERPRLLGDFILRLRGSVELSAYHTFRNLDPYDGHTSAPVHSLGFMRMVDKEQYQRLFYSSDQENLMLFLRWYGDQYKEKLPLGDSYDWDDDEFNRRVSVVVSGSQK